MFNQASQGFPRSQVYLRQCSGETKVAACLAPCYAGVAKGAGEDLPGKRHLGGIRSVPCGSAGRAGSSKKDSQGGQFWEAYLRSPSPAPDM